jgi:Right handed beta helix region
MTRIGLHLVPLAALACVLTAHPAGAQANRTFISGLGSDANPCTFGAPCRSLQAAYILTTPGGEINALDPAGYGPLTITHAISVLGHGWADVTAPAGGAAITIDAGANDKVNLSGLVFEGFGTGLRGVSFTTGASVNLHDCKIRNFSGDGIDFFTSGGSKLVVSNTVISDNGSFGISSGLSGADMIEILDHVVIVSNGGDGVNVNSFDSSGTVNVTVSESDISSNTQNGISVDANGGKTNVMVRNSTIASNRLVGLQSSGAMTALTYTRSTITGNGTGLKTLGGGLISLGDNILLNNTTEGASTSSAAYR